MIETVSLDRLFAFRGLAVIGGTARNPYASQILEGLSSIGYTGDVACVNPRGEPVGTVPGFRTLAEIPFAVDAAAIVVRADRIPDILEQCGLAGVRSVTIVSAGFAEAGETGRALQAAIVQVARRFDIALCGPNCLGFLSLHDRTSTYSRAKLPTRAGDVAVVAHSGGLLNEVLSYGSYRGIFFSKAISAGNEAVVTLADYLDHLIDDPQTTTIGLIVEGVRDPERVRAAFASAARFRKPIVAIKIGSSALAQVSAATHTGAMAGSADLFAALCAQHSVTLVEDIDELCESLLVFSHARMLVASDAPVRGIAAIEISGGGKGLICDIAERRDLPLPPMREATAASVAREFDDSWIPSNPLDVVMTWDSPASLGTHGKLLDALAADGGYDLLISRVSVLPKGTSEQTLDHGRLIADRMRAHPDMLFTVLGRASDAINERWRAMCDETGLIYLQGYKRGLAALAYLWEYRRSASIPAGAPQPVPVPPFPRTNGLLDEGEAKDVLSALGFAVNDTVFAASAAAAVDAARGLGFPVVIKGLSPHAVHKSDGGFVTLDVADERAVRDTATTMLSRLADLGDPGAARLGLTVQRRVAAGLEIIVGGYRDALYGPVVLCALGGVFAEIFPERLLWIAPVDPAAVLRRLQATTIGQLASGFRSLPPTELEPLAATVARVSAWLAADDRVRELDLNPVIVCGSDLTIVDARLLVG